MSKDLQKRAAEMLLNGATLLSEPCPYCKGVRVMKEGQALCIKCGKEPEKGERAKIAKIYFLGDKKMRNRKLRDIITSQENTFWKIFSKNVYLSKERVELDKRLLKRYYKNKGYYEVDISSSNVEYSKGEGFVLTFSVNAGKRYRFKKISVNVAKALDKSAFISLQTEFNKTIGKYYSEKRLTAILEKIDKLSQQKELQFINHRLDETLEAESG